MKSHQEVAAPYKEITHTIPDRHLKDISATSSLYSAETGFSVRGERQAVPVRVTRGLGAAAFNIIELMAVTDEPGREDGARHSAVIAALTRANVLAVGNPGVEYDKYSVMEAGQLNELTDDQVRELKKGNFNLVSQAVSNATMEALEREELEGLETYVVAPSLAGSVASAGLGHMLKRGMNLRGAALLDPVGLESRHGLIRIGQFMKTNFSVEPYLDANHPLQQEIKDPWVDRSKNSLRANFLYGYYGIGTGDARADLLQSAEELRDNNVGLDIYAAVKSEFNTVPMSEQTVEDLLRMGVDARSITLEGASHAMTMMAAMHAEAANGFRLKRQSSI